jgi:hypothetical protein
MAETTRELIARYARQPSTYVPIVALVGYITHRSVPPEIQGYVTVIAAGVASLLVGLINERRGANPNNAPLPPTGTAPVVTPCAEQVKAIVVPAPDISVEVPTTIQADK